MIISVIHYTDMMVNNDKFFDPNTDMKGINDT